MARTPSNRIDEGSLTKGQLRKLTALRKSIGSEIGERAFAEWLSSQPAGEKTEKTDRNAELIVGALWPLVQQGRLAIPRGGYPKAWTGAWPGYRRAVETVVRGMRCREGMGSNDDEAR